MATEGPVFVTLLALVALLAPPPAGALPRGAVHELRSPDGHTVVTVELGDAVRWSVARGGRPVLLPSTIGLVVEGRPALGRSPVARRTTRHAADARLPVPVPVRRRMVLDRHRELEIELRDGLAIVFRAWDDAVAYHLRTALGGEVRVRGEDAEFRFPEGSVGWLPIADCSKRTGQEMRRARVGFARACAAVAVLASARAGAQSAASERALLEQKLAAAAPSKDWASVLQTAARLEEIVESEHVEAIYRVARLHALLGHHDEACEALERLSQAGLFDVSTVRADEAFAPLREDERFKKAVRSIWFRGYLWLLERPERDVYQKPDQVMAALAFRPGERVADVGAGSGYFARRVSKAVGLTGEVLAIDIAPEVLDYLEARARREGLANVHVRRVSADDPQLPPGAVDTILMVDTLHYVKDRGTYAKKLRAGLAPGGRVVVIDFVPKPPEERPWGPPPEQRMSREEVDAAMAEAGLAPARVHDFLTEQFFVEYRVR